MLCLMMIVKVNIRDSEIRANCRMVWDDFVPSMVWFTKDTGKKGNITAQVE